HIRTTNTHTHQYTGQQTHRHKYTGQQTHTQHTHTHQPTACQVGRRGGGKQAGKRWEGGGCSSVPVPYQPTTRGSSLYTRGENIENVHTTKHTHSHTHTHTHTHTHSHIHVSVYLSIY